MNSDTNNYDSLPDKTLVKKVQEGNTKLFEIIIQRYNQQLFRIIRGYLKDRQNIKDVMQTTYLKAFSKLSQFRGEAQFSTWLIRIAINEALKKKKSNSRFSDLYSVTDTQISDQKSSSREYSPDTQVIQKDMNTHLEKAIDTLPPKYRSVLIMREIEQLSTKETAELLEISRPNVKVRLHRAKNMLRDQLSEMLDEIDLLTFKGEECDKLTEQVMLSIQENS
ncbi:RNA polymerase sigma factor [Fodinibius halophilus]|uniref:RNA polymerase sigma factor n=1 Tax=Fodinibius halophilus TaxID=1736908 RepID=A0A6M1SXI1_9BACT|nr:RNA polymerase sigma factor [Fodinibius halophilus]NGP88618.1 RNA polymerase sigma factor [Fodinibius halophilus]